MMIPWSVAVAHQQHPDHQFRINGRTAGGAIKRLKVLADLVEVEELVYLTEKMISRDVAFKTKVVKQGILSSG
jgi:hypothetical protein